MDGSQLFPALRLGGRFAREGNQRTHCPYPELESIEPGRRHERVVDLGATSVVGAGEAPNKSGPHLDLYNNISANPGGLWWPGDRLGFTYYLDGGFKNYLFDNIAWGANNKDKKLANAFAFYEAVGIIHNSNFLIEICFKTAVGQGRSILVEKWGSAGYSLIINPRGGVTLAAKGKSGSATLDSVGKVNDGRWHHLIAEGDRQAKTMTIYLAGRKNASGRGLGPESLANSSDLYLGGSPKGNCLKGTIEFARICQGTLQDAQTTIAELYYWQFHGPQTRDFTGRKPTGQGRDAGALEFVR